MIDATNREGSDGFVAAFADDAVLVDRGRELAGRERGRALERHRKTSPATISSE